MTTLRVETFAGIAPRYSARLLPPTAATIARNAKLISGELRGLHELSVIKDFNVLGVPTRRAFRIPLSFASPTPINTSDFWAVFQDAEVDFVRTPLIGDSFERHYWTSDSFRYGGVPQYNTKQRIIAGDVPFRLGVPIPGSAPVVAPAAGTTDTRYYVYTFLSAYGEEGPPSPPSLAAVGGTGTWNLSSMETTVPNATERNITQKRIYRTVPGFTTSEFYLVGTVPLAQSTFADTTANDVAGTQPLLESTFWSEPPAGLKGLTSHPGGFLVGFSGRDLWLSEPFRPHAWPVQNLQTMQTEIVGIAVYYNSIVVTTNSRPYICDGITPPSVTLQKLDSIDPCVSRRSMVTTLDGVYYASPQGIVKVTPGGIVLATQQLFTREEWIRRYNPQGVKAVPYGMQYLAFDTPGTGFIFAPSEQLAPLSELDRFSSVDGIQVDQYSGDVYIVRLNQLGIWDPTTTLPVSYQWRSKEFDLPKPVNFGALRLKYNNLASTLPPGAEQKYIDFNAFRITLPLNCINLAQINGVRKETVPGWVDAQNKSPIAGSPLFPIAGGGNPGGSPSPNVQVNIYARNINGQMDLVFSQSVSDERIWRLPSGFKSDVWQIELLGNTEVFSVSLAETGKELQNT